MAKYKKSVSAAPAADENKAPEAEVKNQAPEAAEETKATKATKTPEAKAPEATKEVKATEKYPVRLKNGKYKTSDGTIYGDYTKAVSREEILVKTQK